MPRHFLPRPINHRRVPEDPPPVERPVLAGLDERLPVTFGSNDAASIAQLPAASISARVSGRARPREVAAAKFDADPRDTATPEAMVALLQRIYRKDLLKAESAELLLDIMRRCRTGEARLKGMLPLGTEVAHKTGTIGGTTNDVGIVTLPEDAGHVAITVFVKSSEKEVSDRERTIADVARAVYDFFLFQPR